ncbi:uncharacterized protein LOC122019717 isoform X1 [Zingiber officinale]|uniref:NAC domain-containing protein n=1 Tax=Zingiber officinale TaxID=94328 RepID=A0A8J5KFS0_ZINOF|nr:uncharacterized protein LOC122019717 isoform X1 [Zingiber officinale]KAG6479459.1 hypothetical protein ZIOFF_062925 [Zingiber officinale]
MAAFSVDSLPLGFRFRPTDVELVNHYLKGKIRGRIKSEVEVIPVIDVCKCDPWDLPAKALIKSSDEWFFFSPKDRKYPNSGRSNRTTLSGYWKATGKDRTIKARARDTAIIGTKKTLVFYQGRAPKGVRTNWIMHEYRTTEPELDSGKQGGFVLYRLFKKMEEKTGEKTPVSEVDDCLERNIDDTHSSALSSSSTMLSPDGMLNGEVSTGEPVTSLDQKALLCDWQENIQHLPLPSDEQLSGVGELFSDKNNFTINNLPIQEEIHFTGAVASPASGVEFSLDNLAQFDFREFEHEFYDSVEKFVAESKPCQNLEDDYVTEFLDEILCDPEERSPDVSNDCSTLFPCYSYSPSEAFLFRDNTTGIGGDDNTDVIEVFGQECSPPICSSTIWQNSGYTAPLRQGTSQFPLFPNHNFGHNVSFMGTAASMHQESINVENLDNAKIHVRTHRNLFESHDLSEEKVLSASQIRLQKSVQNASVPKTDHISTIKNDIVHSVVNEVPEILEHHEENTESSLDSSINAKKELSHGNAISTVKTSSPLEFGDAEKSDGLRSRRAHNDEIEKKTSDQSLDALAISSGSYSVIRIILILSALLFLLCLGLSWCLSC